MFVHERTIFGSVITAIQKLEKGEKGAGDLLPENPDSLFFEFWEEGTDEVIAIKIVFRNAGSKVRKAEKVWSASDLTSTD